LKEPHDVLFFAESAHSQTHPHIKIAQVRGAVKHYFYLVAFFGNISQYYIDRFSAALRFS